MQTVNEVIDNIGDTFTGLFTGGYSGGTVEWMKTHKIASAFIIGFIVILLIIAVYYIYNNYFASFNSRNTGPSGCCGKSQNPRNQVITGMFTDGEMDNYGREMALAGQTPIKDMYPGNQGYDNTNFTGFGAMGFASPAAKPTADDQGPGSEQLFGNQPIVRPQVPSSKEIRPSYTEADFVNMAYSS